MGACTDRVTELYLKHHKTLLYRASRRLKYTSEVEDLVNELWFKLVKLDKSGNWPIDERPPRPFLYRCIDNLIIDKLRKEKNQPKALQTDLADIGIILTDCDPLNQLMRNEPHKTARQVYESLPRKYREIIELCVFRGLNSREAAEIAKINGSTARWRLHKARQLLSRMYEERAGDSLPFFERGEAKNPKDKRKTSVDSPELQLHYSIFSSDDLVFHPEPNLERQFLPAQIRGAQQKRQADSESRYWYAGGVLPISIDELQTLEGTLPIDMMRKEGANGRAYVDRARPISKASLVYLTDANVDYFFLNPCSDDYRKIRDRIENNRFNEIKGVPFEFFTPTDIFHHRLTIYDFSKIRELLADPEFVRVPVRDGAFAFALTQDTVAKFTSSGALGREANLKALREELKDHYREFQSWQPCVDAKVA